MPAKCCASNLLNFSFVKCRHASENHISLFCHIVNVNRINKVWVRKWRGWFASKLSINRHLYPKLAIRSSQIIHKTKTHIEWIVQFDACPLNRSTHKSWNLTTGCTHCVKRLGFNVSHTYFETMYFALNLKWITKISRNSANQHTQLSIVK